ncbi:MAG: LemA family protein [Bdellovibrionota bacterium]
MFANLTFPVIGLIGVAVVGGLFLTSVYNSLVGLRLEVDRSWANIDLLLKQFHDEIPMIVQLCEQYMKYERGTIDQILQARSRYGSATATGDKVDAANALGTAMRGIFALGEAYPDLKSNEQFRKIEDRISTMQDHLSDRREMFNSVVTAYNARIQSAPEVFVASFFGFQPLNLFKVDEADKTAPKLELKIPA